MLDRLHHLCLTYSPTSDHQYREQSDKRFGMNDRGNFFAEPWKAVMKQLLDPQHPFVHVTEEICAEFDHGRSASTWTCWAGTWCVLEAQARHITVTGGAGRVAKTSRRCSLARSTLATTTQGRHALRLSRNLGAEKHRRSIAPSRATRRPFLFARPRASFLSEM
jgi:hypothetical protein